MCIPDYTKLEVKDAKMKGQGKKIQFVPPLYVSSYRKIGLFAKEQGYYKGEIIGQYTGICTSEAQQLEKDS